ncbi:MAG: glycosyltransferase [Chitinophagaceae bacterium]|nr:MAG: glycosyltransferase [Chitinophagaceae bacterium]
MLQNRNILCISVPAWKGEYAATIVELMKVFGRSNKVLYVQNPYSIKDLLQAILRGKKFPYAAALGLRSRITRTTYTGGEVCLLTAPVLLTINFLPPGFLYNAALKFNGWLLRGAVRRALHKLNMQQDLINVVAFNPILGNETGKRFNEKLLLYHCYDEISEAVWMKKHGASAERAFMKLADAVIVTSRGLLEKKSAMSGNVFLVRNAADIRLFATAFTELPPVRRTIGYIGSLDNRLDYDLLENIAAGMPEAELLLAGRIVDKPGTDRLRRYPNVRFTGALALEELPALVKTFSAGIIPFVLNGFTKGIYPLKINEYLAAGIPVVSTHFSYLDDFKGLISIAESHAEFTDMLTAEMNSDNTAKKRERQAAAASNTWENRVEEFSAIIRSLENRSDT